MNDVSGLGRRRVVVVTGGSRGIGRAIIAAFSARGDVVWSLSRNPPRKPLPAGCRSIRADLRSSAQVKRAVARIRAASGLIDVWINNVGGGAHLAFDGGSLSRWWEVFDLNFSATVNGCSAVRGALRTPGASIVNMASLAGLMAPGGHSAYSSAKAAVLAFTRALAVEWAGHGIRVNAIAPGPVETEAFFSSGGEGRKRAKSIPTGRLASAGEIASACLFLTQAGPSLTGHTLVMDGGASAAGCYACLPRP